MEGATAVRVGSAAAASTSHPCTANLSSVRLLRNAQRANFCSCPREGFFPRVRLHQGRAMKNIRTRAIAREFTKVNGVRINGTKVEGTKLSGGKIDEINEASLISQDNGVSSSVIAAMAAAILAVDKQRRVEAMTHKTTVPIDSLRRGKLVEGDFVYRQTFVIRSYEAGFDKVASIETITNLFQETALNHVGMSDFVGDGMGSTHAMIRHRLIWVVTRMHVEVDRYPVWGDVVEIDSWVAAEGKNGMRRDFLVRDYTTGQIITRATSTWVMMNQDTRRLSKMPEDVLAEISPYYLDRSVIKEDPCQKIKKLTNSAPYIRSDLVPRLNDMDMNQHVNNVKYIGWVLESVPQSLLVAHELRSMTLEYRRECTPADVVQSLSCPDPPLPITLQRSGDGMELLGNGALDGSPGAVSCSSGALKSATQSPPKFSPVCYTHLLRMQSDGTEIVRGRTVWRTKQRYSPSHGNAAAH